MKNKYFGKLIDIKPLCNNDPMYLQLIHQNLSYYRGIISHVGWAAISEYGATYFKELNRLQIISLQSHKPDDEKAMSNYYMGKTKAQKALDSTLNCQQSIKLCYELRDLNSSVEAWMDGATDKAWNLFYRSMDVSRHVDLESIKKQELSKAAQRSVNVRHNQKGGTREKKNLMLKAWATGNYKTHKACAVAMCKQLDIEHETALKHLTNAPKPS